MTLGGHAKEDRFWAAAVRSLAPRLGRPEAVVVTRSICVDSKRQWRRISSTGHNSMVRTLLQTASGPFSSHSRYS